MDALKKVCQGIKSTIQLFELDCNYLDFVEEGCNLSSKSTVKAFYDVNKKLSQKLFLDENKEAYKVISEFGGSDELLKFAFDRKSETEIDFMKEAVNDYDESHISTQAIFDFTNLWSYVTELNRTARKKTLEIFLKKIKDLSQNNLYAGIVENLKSSKINFYGIQNLYLELSHKEEAKRKQIFKIVDQSLITFVKPKTEFDVELKCITKAGERENLFHAPEIFELRDRAHLIVFTEQKKMDFKEDNNYKEEELKKFKAFSTLADTINQILNTLMKLKFNGYPRLQDLKVVNTNSRIEGMIFDCNAGDFGPLHDFKEQLEKILEEWDRSIIEAYKYHYELTYLKGKDFWRVERALIDPASKKSVKGRHLLDYIGKKPAQVNLDAKESPENRLGKLGQALKELPNVYKVDKNQKFVQDYTFFIAERAEKAIIKALVSLYLTYEKSMPLSSHLLICHSSTSWNELVAFAFRCFFSPEQKLFCLIQPERLGFALQDQFSTQMKNLNNEYPRNKFHLAFVTTDANTHLITSLKVKSQTKVLKNEELLKNAVLEERIRDYTQNCRNVTSKITGLGKTTWIMDFVKKSGHTYNKIPISGTIDPIELGNRLLPILSQERPALCFSIGSIEESDKSLLNEVLFSLVVLRSFHFSTSVVKVPETVQIFFEIDSSYFENLKDDIEILSYIQTENIDTMRIEDLHYKSPQVQFVCYYLKGLVDGSLGTNDLSEFDIRDKELSKDECLKLITQKFLENRDKDYASYTQLRIFIDVLYSLFRSFSENGYFIYSVLSKTKNPHDNQSVFLPEDVIINMRLNLIDGLVLAADQFTSKSVENVRQQQKMSMNIAKDRMAVEDVNNALGGAVVSWENSRPFTVVFSVDQSPIFVYKQLDSVPKAVVDAMQNQIQAAQGLGRQLENPLKDYKECSQVDLYERLVSLTNKLHNRNICLKCYRKYEKNLEICNACGIPLLLNNDPDSRDFVKKVAIASGKDYALTPDNFIKMLLIFMRVQQRIPVIIMGETGCGKTSLIRFLCSRILEDEFKIFSIHAGVNHDNIKQEMQNYIQEAQILQLADKKIWVFFDEFNTTASIGLIKEILCERTMLGEPLPDNMVFLGACNPWRLKTQQIVFDENVGIKKDRLNQGNKYNLLYTVYPLPETMIDFVWDYGHLTVETEKKYVEAMFTSLAEIEKDVNLKNIMVDLVCAAHQQFRNWEDVSSVSLRDVTRYKILFEWFLSSLRKRDEMNRKKRVADKILKNQAVILALLHCYYLRIASKKKRNEFLIKIEPYLKKFDMNKKDVEDLLLKQELDLLDRMKPLPEGIATNRALRENIFALVVCILTKIPIFICGKPGCSKSLAVQLVFNHLRGRNSTDDYFRTLPELIPVSFQGSEYCTSESIVSVFNRAEKYLNVNAQNKDILPVIIFDEIGLAEISTNNPLKVLHNKLEIENVKVAFVGISNWRLDASKMNRALYLARPDPDIEDLKFTANAIYNSISKNIPLADKVVDSLARIYCDLRDLLKQQKQEDIFGLRDYYFLIKGISVDMVKLEHNERFARYEDDALYTIIRKNLKKNFSGLGNEHEALWYNFCQYMGTPEKQVQIQEPSAKELIFNNLSDRNSRYLMLITQSDCVSEYIEELIRNKDAADEAEQRDQQGDDEDEMGFKSLIIKRVKEDAEGEKEVKTLVGSHMIDDLTKQSYGFRVLSDIILYIEKGYTLIFKKIDNVYSSLYDLFNQNFSVSGDKKYCRIALGALYNPKCLVHKDFHCVIFINESEVEKADPPFLNRFEKYRIRIEDILSANQRTLQTELVKWVYSITTWENEPDFIKPELVFANYNA